MVDVLFPGVNRTWVLEVAAESEPAWEAFTEIMVEHEYWFRDGDGGTYSCRAIAGTSRYSLHAYGIALDLNPKANPYGWPLRYDYPAGFIADVEALRTNSGASVFTWGGRWTPPDAMHWQINCSPDDLETGLDMALPDEDIQKIARAVWAVYPGVPASQGGASSYQTLIRTHANTVTILSRLGDLTELDATELQAIADAVADEIASRP